VCRTNVWQSIEKRKRDNAVICGSEHRFRRRAHGTLRTTNKGSARPARNIRSDSETFAVNFVADWDVHGDKWQSPHWREKIAQTTAKLQRFIHCRCLHGFCHSRRL